jgi:Mg/Co/Ni transporter MgtE
MTRLTKRRKMTLIEQIKKILRSRKFWVLVSALLATAAACVSGEISVWQALQAAVAALAVYSTGVAIEDNRYGSQQH